MYILNERKYWRIPVITISHSIPKALPGELHPMAFRRGNPQYGCEASLYIVFRRRP
jgi:hypothetical protein